VVAVVVKDISDVVALCYRQLQMLKPMVVKDITEVVAVVVGNHREVVAMVV
jgi:hypothetical protein